MKTVRSLLVAALLSGAVLAPTAQAATTRCYDKIVYRPVQDPHRITGTVIGAALGGLIGHQVGGGKGRDLATVAGAVGGGVAGHKIHRARQERLQRQVIRVCD